MDWFDGVVAAVQDVPLDTLPLRPLLVLCRRVLAGFPILYSQGLICKILSDDLGGNIAKVEGALAEMERLAVAERASQAGGGASSGSDPAAAAAGGGGGGGSSSGGGGGSGGDGSTAAAAAAAPAPLPHSPAGSLRSASSSPGLGYAPAAGPWFSDLTDWAPQPAAGGVFGARWIVRVLRFVTLLLSKLGSDPALSISLAGRQTYTAIIAPFHAPVMGFVVRARAQSARRCRCAPPLRAYTPPPRPSSTHCRSSACCTGRPRAPGCSRTRCTAPPMRLPAPPACAWRRRWGPWRRPATRT